MHWEPRSRIYVFFQRACCCVRIFTDLDKERFDARLQESLRDKKSFFLTVYERNGKGFKRSHTTVTPYEVLKDCCFHAESLDTGAVDECADKAHEARVIEELMAKYGAKSERN
ncbi:hypothetical protein SAMN02746041_02827 [Desulfacinum hydrothermale DSM 13146]|uniref:Uncharacterized protein n=1 Tax=Desulfacinum hydrothermale DSM 13146 TaxID=1121390 RepID=A0A1W1XSM9_9BACT|nr:hypothetical protein [Desulfacinum hydrothermale]SMC26969.1 hypothetical protein SAMN02746041_02827 [Desulfacinum hydrothermale DSM 13146]